MAAIRNLSQATTASDQPVWTYGLLARCHGDPVIERIQAAGRALVLGIGGGGDVVGAMAVARLCESLGLQVVLGGVAWERFAIDPRPGPRPMEQVRDAEPLGEHAALARPATATADGIAFAEAGVAHHLRARTV